MNNDLAQFSEERLKEIAQHGLNRGIYSDDLKSLARIALAAKQAKPVAITDRGEIAGLIEDGWVGNFMAPSYKGVDKGDEVWLYTTPQPAHTERDGWIKCSDDLPLIGVEVQVYIPGNAQTGRPTVTAMARFVNRQGAPDYFWDKSTGKGGMTLDTSVTHWRPLAAAPKPESE